MPDTHVGNPTREIRVFLSSTFQDMQEERNYLMSHVFPLVRQRCHEREVVFTEIDLRWGITEEAAHNGRTVELCLQEIERCRVLGTAPFFIGFLGGRYGWIPGENDLAAYWDAHRDSPYVKPIREALSRGISVTELEIRFGFLDAPAMAAPRRVLMLMRDAALTRTISARMQAQGPSVAPKPSLPFGARLRRWLGPSPAPAADPASNKLDQLKDVVRVAHRDSAIALVDGYASVEAFGAAIHHFLMQELDALFPLLDAPDMPAQVTAAHRVYAASRLRCYIDEPALAGRMLEWLRSPAITPLAMLCGPSGAGKSATLAAFDARLSAASDCWIFTHFCGVAGYTDLAHWRDRLLDALRSEGWGTASLPLQDAERWTALPLWLARAVQASGRSIVLLLDAVNQLTDAAAALDQLEHMAWPAGVRLIASCTPDLELAPAWHQLAMPALDAAARRDFVAAYLGNFSKSISASLMHTFADAAACDNRLFLKLVLEEVRIHASHESLATLVAELLRHADSGALFLACLAGLDGDFASHGRGLATAAARLLGASRRGLTQHELAELLAAPGQARLPDAIVLPLLANMQPYLEQHGGRLQLMHAILAEAVQADHRTTLATRNALSAYFSGDQPWALTERAYQAIRIEFADSQKLVQNMFVGELDEIEADTRPGESHLMYLFRRHEESNQRIVQSFASMPVFLQIFALDTTIALNGLETIGAGKPWQSTDSQLALVDAWFASLDAMTVEVSTTAQLVGLGGWFIERGFVLLAETFLARLLDWQRKRAPGQRAACAAIATQLGKAQLADRAYDAAVATLTAAVEDWDGAALAAGSVDSQVTNEGTIAALTLLARALRRLDQPHLALPLQERAMGIHTAALARFDEQACDIAIMLALIYAECGKPEQARALAESTLTAARELLGPAHRDLAPMLEVAAAICMRGDDLAASERFQRAAIVLLRSAPPGGQWALANALSALGALREKMAEDGATEAIYEEAWTHYLAADATADAGAMFVLQRLGALKWARGDREGALTCLEQVLDLCDTGDDAPASDRLAAARTCLHMAVLLVEQGEPAQAGDRYSEARKLLARLPQTEETRALMTQARQREGAPAEAPAPSFAANAAAPYTVSATVVRYQPLGSR